MLRTITRNGLCTLFSFFLAPSVHAQPPRATPTAPRPNKAAYLPVAIPNPPPLQGPSALPAGDSTPENIKTPEGLAAALSELLYEAIPREYEKKKDWDRKKNITVGLKTDGDWYKFRVRRRKKAVNHGTWKYYKVKMIDPEEHLDVRIENLRSLKAGQIAFSCFFESKLEYVAKARIYNRGVHIITLSGEGTTGLRLWLDCEVTLKLTPATVMSGLAIQPEVVNARLELDDFDLDRVSKAKGPLVHELGDGLRFFIEEELDGPKLAAKLNRAIEKKKDRLRFAPAEVFKLSQEQPEEISR